MEIIQATEKDLQSVLDLMSNVVENLSKKGIFQWDSSYPNRDIFLKDIKNHSLYVIKDNNSYLGTITLNEEQAPEYCNVDWLTSNKKTLVIHRLAVSPNYQGKGIGRKLIDFAEQLGHKKNYDSIRLDAFSKNLNSVNFYEKCGYIKTGEVYFGYQTSPFPCFEKILY
ncbi:GNAT family N-acetyltransferase [Clostridium brassicae]|uniref:GNAT family N-acetyltransferase n=1 Tax=Clostridium brassicae TaxID=2999072 RepID=A0ABT4DA06_9CLOT|nr:GNAT family N-acetyltransferase [Clostridium brassicae]MCY6959140.1 GNAT family N-acetyltransferase [Clostridium brassicae]